MDFTETLMSIKHDGSICAVDVMSIVVKGKRSQLHLTDDEVIIKLKKSKLYGIVKFGFFVNICRFYCP